MEDLPQYMLKRGRIYYMRLRVPTELVKISKGKISILKSLQTSDLKEAKKRLAIEINHAYAEFDRLRREHLSKNKNKTPLSGISETEIMSMIYKWMKQTEIEDQNALQKDTYIWEEMNINMLETKGDLAEALKEKDFEHGKSIAANLLKEQCISYDKASKEFQKMSETLTRAELELTIRALQYHQGKPITGSGEQLFAHFSSAPAQVINKKQKTFGELCGLYEKLMTEKVTPRGLKGIQQEIAILKNFISPDISLHEIDSDKGREVVEFIKQMPAHASKIYPGENIRKAIELSKKDGNSKISPKRANTYIERLKSIFSIGIEEQFMNFNPISKNMRSIDKRLKKDLRYPFSPKQLQTIFSAPLYTGCANDEYGYNKKGNKKPRRGKFWVPLIALWTGMRLTEICQLDTADIKKINGIDIIEISPSEDKQVKTENAIRIVPIHAELKKLGFLEYVESIKQKNHKKLFPDLMNSENYSLTFSKWFGRFLDNLGIADKKLTFHSFRHNFRDALRDAELPNDYVRALCGWAGDSVVDSYGSGEIPEKLNKHHKKMRYKHLDLSHLYSKA